MSEAHAAASRARWARVSKKQRSERMRAIALKRHAMLSPKQRRAIAIKMVEARRNKKLKGE